MAGPVYYACKQCRFIFTDTNICPRCGDQGTKDWQGMIAVTDFERSEIAKKMGITSNGCYALKVR